MPEAILKVILIYLQSTKIGVPYKDTANAL
jgi:hypothetical protein